MRRIVAPLGVMLALAAGAAQADPAATTSDQISGPASSAVGASQIDPAARASVGATSQITAATPRADAPDQAAARTLDTSAAPVKGSDRCDAAAAGAHRPECAHIVDSRADELAPAPKTAPTTTVSPDASGDALVNGIVSGGTGGVVQLPPN